MVSEVEQMVKWYWTESAQKFTLTKISRNCSCTWFYSCKLTLWFSYYIFLYTGKYKIILSTFDMSLNEAKNLNNLTFKTLKILNSLVAKISFIHILASWRKCYTLGLDRQKVQIFSLHKLFIIRTKIFGWGFKNHFFSNISR